MANLEHIIATLPRAIASPTLKSRILARIAELEAASYRLHRRVFGAIAALSGALLVPAGIVAFREFSASAFGTYLSLGATDTAAALVNWKEFSLSLLESAPIWGAVIVLVGVFVFLASLKALAPYLEINYGYTKNT